jgi:glycosyltransferase involved in cell wall biosynthesis
MQSINNLNASAATLFSPCVIIPVYNHPKKIADLVAVLASQNMHCVLIDDGSETACAQVLDAVSNDFPATSTLLRLKENKGKGVAVCEGLLWAFEKRFTHAIQIDADGQHDLGDLPRFLQAAVDNPNAVVCGWRNYDDMPRSRRSGRKLTDFWVCVNTLSCAIKDSMCGYRLYPLRATKQLLVQEKIGARMDFDTDILVKLYWQGLDVINVPIQIIYHQDITSHFDILKDNVRISWMHTRLFFGMLWRLTKLIKR